MNVANNRIRRIVNFTLALLACMVIYTTLAGCLGAFIVFDIGAQIQSRWQVHLFTWSGTPLLAIGAFTGILIYRTRPLLFGITCALAATTAVALCTAEIVLLTPMFTVKWVLFFIFSTLGTYLGWWILRLHHRQNVMLKVWQAFVAFVIVFGALSLFSWSYSNRISNKLIEPMIQALQ